jgi:hypothetical protein
VKLFTDIDMKLEFDFDTWYKLANNNLYLAERPAEESDRFYNI